MNILSTITSAFAEHPVALSVAAAIGIRVVVRDIGAAKKYVADQAKAGWDGIERRGPNRAKNVIRPEFGVSRLPVETVEEVRRTGTKG